MAQGRLIPILENVRGRIGDLVVKQYGSKVVLTRRPVFRNRIFSEAQRAYQERFRQAALYVTALLRDPRAREAYKEEARREGKSVRSLMMADFLHARSPHEVVGEKGSEVVMQK